MPSGSEKWVRSMMTWSSRRVASARGFTLIELLVVLAIITLLASLFLPVLKQALNRGRAITCLSNLRQCGLMLASDGSDRGGVMTPAYIADIDTKTAGDQMPYDWPRGGCDHVPPEGGYTWQEMLLDFSGDLTWGWYRGGNAHVFQCPAGPWSSHRNLWTWWSPAQARQCVNHYAMNTRAGIPPGGSAQEWVGASWAQSSYLQFLGEPPTVASIEDPQGTLWLCENFCQYGWCNAWAVSIVCPNLALQADGDPVGVTYEAVWQRKHDGKMSVLFVDGHAALHTPEETIGTGTMDKYNVKGMWTSQRGD